MERTHSAKEGASKRSLFNKHAVSSFADMPIKLKVGIPVSIAIFILVFNHLLGFYFKAQQSDSDEWLDSIAQSQLQAQSISHLLRNDDLTEESTLEALDIAVFQVDNQLNALAAGGSTAKKGGKQSTYIAPLPKQVQPSLQYLRAQWEAYRAATKEMAVRSKALRSARKMYRDTVSVARVEKLSSYLHQQENLIRIEGLSASFIRQADILIDEIKHRSTEETRLAQILEIVFMIINVISMLSVLTVISRYILSPVKDLAEASKAIALGDLQVELYIHARDEVGEIATATRILKENLREATQLTVQIGQGNYEAHLETMDESSVKKDTLFGALLLMREELKRVSEEEKRRSWATLGLAKFGEILRADYPDFRAFTEVLISELVRYVGANQGGIFVANRDDETYQFLELLGCYGYGKKRFMTKTIKLRDGRAEGLLGQAFLERNTIVLNDVPDKYVTITSGLGEATPNSVMIVPLKYEDRVEGVIELAAFGAFEPYQIDFVEKLAASITATIEASKRNEQMRKLLNESQIRAEELRAQEEEMRQNMEELHATQEEMQRSEAEMQQRVAQSQAREAEAMREKWKLEKMLSQLPAMVYQVLVKSSGLREFLYVSEGVQSLLDIPKSAFKGDATLINRIHPDDLTTFHRTLDDAFDTLDLWRWEGRFLVGEKTVWLATVAHPEVVEGGALVFTGVFTDIENLFTDDQEVEIRHERLVNFKLQSSAVPPPPKME